MSSAGHIFDMIARMKANEALRKKKSYFKTIQDYLHVTGGKRISFRHTPKEELENIRNKIIHQRKKEFRRLILAFFISILITAVVIWLLTVLIKQYL